MDEYDITSRILNKVLKKCVDKAVDDDIRQGIELAIKLSKERLAYSEKVSTEPSQPLKLLGSETKIYPFSKAFEDGKTKCDLTPDMMTGDLEGKFLQSIIMMIRAKRVLEIGMFTGYASLACAEVLPEDGEVVTCEFDPFLKDIARRFFDTSPHGHKIDIRIAPASDTLLVLAKEKRQFDVIFIDANKDGYIDYYKTVISKNLLAENGVIAVDNALFFGMPYSLDEKSEQDRAMVIDTVCESYKRNGESVKRFNNFMMTQNDVFKVLLPIRDGILLVQKKPKAL